MHALLPRPSRALMRTLAWRAPTRARLWRALAWTLLIGSCLHFLAAGVLRPILRPYGYASDFAAFYAAARAFTAGQDPYDRDLLDTQMAPEFAGWVGRYLYPPPFAAVVLRPLGALPFAAARRVWIVVESTAFVVAGILMLRRFAPDPTLWGIAVAGASMFLFTPMRVDLKLGSVSGLLLLLFALFLDCRARGQQGRASLALAAMIVLKLAPAVLLFYLWWRGEWRWVVRTALACTGILVLALPWTGIQSHANYLSRVVPDLFTQPFAWFTNQSLDAFFTRLFLPNPDTTPWVAAPALARGLTLATGLGVLVALGRVARRDAQTPDASAAGPALALLASLLLARITWESMVVLSLPCFLLGLRAAWRPEAPWGQRAAWALGYALCALPFPYAAPPVRAGAGLLLESPRLYGMLLLFATQAANHRRRGASAPLTA